ncbi:MAG: hypothetical protein JOY85_12405, partial [Acidobacteriaceae bacterium]|nr:hypothetical protein [Acidobacteriaceae bacterium]
MTKFSVLACALISASVLFAQDQDEGHWPVTLGLKGGVPITGMFSASNTGILGPSIINSVNGVGQFSQQIPGSAFSSHTARYILGASAEFRVPFHHLRFEVDGLYKRGGFNSALPFGGALAYRPTTFNWWEIPGLSKSNVSLGHFRPFFDVGASYRHIASITETAYLPGAFQPVYNNNSIAMYNRNSFGGVAGFGMTFKRGPFELTPEVRYTRWANQAFANPNGLRTNLDQGDFLLGISF